RLRCATEVAARWKDAASCFIANDVGLEACLLIVATEARNPRVLVDSVPAERARARLLSGHALAARDPEAISLISSDEARDLAIILTYMAIGMDRVQLDTTHCTRLRASDTTHSAAAGCRKMAAWAVEVARQWEAAEAEGRGRAFLSQLETTLQGSTLDLGEEILQMPDPGEVRAN